MINKNIYTLKLPINNIVREKKYKRVIDSMKEKVGKKII